MLEGEKAQRAEAARALADASRRLAAAAQLAALQPDQAPPVAALEAERDALNARLQRHSAQVRLGACAWGTRHALEDNPTRPLCEQACAAMPELHIERLQACTKEIHVGIHAPYHRALLLEIRRQWPADTIFVDITTTGIEATACNAAAQIMETQAALTRAQAEEEGRAGTAAASNPAEARRWNGVRTIVEARSLLKTVFRAAAGHKAQVCGGAGLTLAGPGCFRWPWTASHCMLCSSVRANGSEAHGSTLALLQPMQECLVASGISGCTYQ